MLCMRWRENGGDPRSAAPDLPGKAEQYGGGADLGADRSRWRRAPAVHSVHCDYSSGEKKNRKIQQINNNRPGDPSRAVSVFGLIATRV